MIIIIMLIIVGVTLAIFGTSLITKTFALLASLLAFIFSLVIALITFSFITIMILTALIGIIFA